MRSIATSTSSAPASSGTSPFATACWRSSSRAAAACGVGNSAESTITPLIETSGTIRDEDLIPRCTRHVPPRIPTAGPHELRRAEQISDGRETAPDVSEPREWEDQEDRQPERDMRLIDPRHSG